MTNTEIINHCKRHGINISINYTATGKFYMEMKLNNAFMPNGTSRPLNPEVSLEELDEIIFSLERELTDIVYMRSSTHRSDNEGVSYI